MRTLVSQVTNRSSTVSQQNKENGHLGRSTRLMSAVNSSYNAWMHDAAAAAAADAKLSSSAKDVMHTELVWLVAMVTNHEYSITVGNSAIFLT